MGLDNRKSVLRMIPYGLYVITSTANGKEFAASTIDWLTQTSFHPPIIAAGIKTGSTPYHVIRESKKFAVNILTKGQQSMAAAFFKSVKVEEDVINGYRYQLSDSGSPILENIAAYFECRLIKYLDIGDHSIYIGEVVNTVMNTNLPGRPDDHTLRLKDLGENIFYGG